MRLLGTSGRDLWLRRLWRRLLRLGWSGRGLFGSGRLIFGDRGQHHRSHWMRSRDFFHCAAATAAQVLPHGRTHEGFPAYLDFAATPRIHTSIAFIASYAALVP